MIYEIGSTNYKIRHSAKAQSARIVLKGSLFEVVIPKGLPESYAHSLAEKKKDWMHKHASIVSQSINQFKLNKPLPKTKQDVIGIKYHLKKDITDIIKKYHATLGRPNQLKLKKMTSRWGSLSTDKNMNINWLLAFAPKDVLEYVVVHELCHLTYMNHSKAFWQLVEANFPNFKHTEKWLKQYGNTLLSFPTP